MPEGAVYVGRPTIWGNPYWHVAKFHGVERALDLYRMSASGMWLPQKMDDWPDHYVHQVYEDHLRWTERIGGHPTTLIIAELKGRDLACWCSLDDPLCHAEILLEIANQ